MLSSKLVLTNQALHNASSQRNWQQARTPTQQPRHFITNGSGGVGTDDDLASPITAKLSGAAARKHIGTIRVSGGSGTHSSGSGYGTGGSRGSRRGGGKSCGSQDSDAEHILRARGSSFATTAVASDVVDPDFDGGEGEFAMGPVGGINKTVEFELEVTRSFGSGLPEEGGEGVERVETGSESSSSSR